MGQFAQIVFSCDEMHITPFFSWRHQTFVQVKNRTFQTMFNVHTHENEDIFYDCHQDFTIWEFFVWYVSFLGHKLCELVQTLATIVLTHSCKKSYSNHKEKCCSSLAHQFVCCHNFNAKFGIQPNLSYLPLLMDMIILSHIFPH
jgi:hypothetical protein